MVRAVGAGGRCGAQAGAQAGVCRHSRAPGADADGWDSARLRGQDSARSGAAGGTGAGGGARPSPIRGGGSGLAGGGGGNNG
jgi:hypothetical protein